MLGDFISLGIGSPASIRAFILLGLSAGGGAGTPPSILSSSVPPGYQDIAYSYQLAADGDAPITWAVTVGALPTGLSLSAGGLLAGAPTVLETQAFTIAASNTTGADTQAYSLTIAAAASGASPFAFRM